MDLIVLITYVGIMVSKFVQICIATTTTTGSGIGLLFQPFIHNFLPIISTVYLFYAILFLANCFDFSAS